MKCGHGFGDHSQDGQLARWGLGRDTKWRSCYAQKRLRNAKQGNHLKIFKFMLFKIYLKWSLPHELSTSFCSSSLTPMNLYAFTENETIGGKEALSSDFSSSLKPAAIVRSSLGEASDVPYKSSYGRVWSKFL